MAKCVCSGSVVLVNVCTPGQDCIYKRVYMCVVCGKIHGVEGTYESHVPGVEAISMHGRIVGYISVCARCGIQLV